MAAIARTAKLTLVCAAASAAGRVLARCPTSASSSTTAAPASHRRRRKRCQGGATRLSAAATAPLTTKATPAIAHHGPAVRSCMARPENRPCHRSTKSKPARLSWICTAIAASTPHVSAVAYTSVAGNGPTDISRLPFCTLQHARCRCETSNKPDKARPGLGPGVFIALGHMAQGSRSAATLRLPHPGADAIAAAPGAAAGVFRQPPGSESSLVAMADIDDYGAVLSNPAADVNLRSARIQHVAVADTDRITVGWIANAGSGDNHDTPEPVVAGNSLGWSQHGNRCSQRHR